MAVDRGIAMDVMAEGRARCYKARDAFFACVDTHMGKEVPTEIGRAGLLYPPSCKAARREYEKSCRSTWVHHFDHAYGAKKRVQLLLSRDSSAPGSKDRTSSVIGSNSGR